MGPSASPPATRSAFALLTPTACGAATTLDTVPTTVSRGTCTTGTPLAGVLATPLHELRAPGLQGCLHQALQRLRRQASPDEPECKQTSCYYAGGETRITTNGLEKFHCEKVTGFKVTYGEAKGQTTNCKCFCSTGFKCVLKHHHTTGYLKAFNHC